MGLTGNNQLVFFALLVLYVTTRSWGIWHKQGLYFDDAATLITVGGNGMRVYDKTKSLMDVGTTLNASEWSNLLTQNAPFNWQGVGDKLISKDLHPPLYFYIAHGWCSVFGFSGSALLFLQVLLEILLLVVLWSFTRRVFRENEMLGLLAFFATIMHVSLSESLLVLRHYHLLAIITLVFHLALFHINRKRKSSKYLVLGVLAFLGFITHFYFPIIIAAHLLAMLFYSNKRVLAMKYGVLFLAVFILTFWGFYDFFIQMLDGRREFTHSGSDYLTYALGAPLRLFLPRSVLEHIPLVLLGFAWPVIGGLIYGFRKHLSFLATISASVSIIFLIILVLLLLMGKVPVHSFSENRYYIVFSLLVIPAVFLLIHQVFPSKPSMGIAVLAILLLQSAYSLRTKRHKPLSTSNIVLVAKYVPDVFVLTQELNGDESVFVTTNPEQLLGRDLTGATVLWPRMKLQNEQENALRKELGLTGEPTPFIYSGWALN